MDRRKLLLGAFLFFFLQAPGVSWGQVSYEVRREASRLQRLAANVWEGLLEETRFGSRVDQRTRLDVFNFVNGVDALYEQVESGRAQASELADVLGLLRLQSEAVDRSLRSVRTGRLVLRDWDEARTSLNSIARLITPGREPPLREGGRARNRQNVNDLEIRIKQVKHSGNIFESKYRVRGVISGRNIVSAGIYSEGRLIKRISVRRNDRHFRENSFKVRLERPDGDVTVRVIDNRGFVLERPLEFPAGGLFPGFK